MKTEKKIKYRIEKLESEIKLKDYIELIDSLVISKKGEIYALNWVLEDSKPKRTIFDLTNKELEELVLIAINETEFVKPIESNKKTYIGNIEFTIMTEPDDIACNIELIISDNLDFDLTIFNTTSRILNQAKLRERLNEMLQGV